jgi:hypothetical protein
VGQTTEQIANHIDNTREDLKANVEELGNKVKAVTDWRQQFQKRPGTMIAAALGGGVILAAMLRSDRRNSAGVSWNGPPASTAGGPPMTQNKREIFDTWNTIKGALVGVAATKFKGILGDVIPGFKEQLDKAERERAADHDEGIERTH